MIIATRRFIVVCGLYTYVWIGLGISRIAIKLISFKKLMSLIVTTTDEADVVSVYSKSRLYKIGTIIEKTAKYTPWRSLCFEQALVACSILAILRCNYMLFFGMKISQESDITAHAWVKVGDYIVTGGSNISQYSVVFKGTSIKTAS